MELIVRKRQIQRLSLGFWFLQSVGSFAHHPPYSSFHPKSCSSSLTRHYRSSFSESEKEDNKNVNEDTNQHLLPTKNNQTFHFSTTRKHSITPFLPDQQYPSRTTPNATNMNGYTPLIDRYGYPAWEYKITTKLPEQQKWIRIDQEFVDPSNMNDIKTIQQVWERIYNVRSLQEKYGFSDLLPRTWISTTTTTTTSSSSTTITTTNTTTSFQKSQTSTTYTFSVAQFNALAEGLSAGPHIQTPFLIHQHDHHHDNNHKNNPTKEDDTMVWYGGFTSIPHPNIVLDFNLRKWRLLEVLLTSNGSTTLQQQQQPCDIIAMEEVDRYRSFFAPMLRLFGYNGAFVPKSKAPGVPMGWYSDGCALFWNTRVFTHVSQRHHGYSVGNQVALHVVLQHQETQKTLVVVVTHLKSKCNVTNEQIRKQQVQELMEEIDQTVQTIVSDTQDYTHDVPVLLLGDFNTEPPCTVGSSGQESAVYQLTTRTSNNNNNNNNNNNYKSLYPLDSSTYYTTWKVRGSMTYKRIIDYIFYRGPLRPVAILEVPDETSMEASKLPGLRYPSDHVLIAGRFDLL